MNENENNNRQATQVDVGWRGEQNDNRQATQVDVGWRGEEKDGRKATEVDAGWRSEAAGEMSAQDVLNSADANYFNTIDAFKNTVETLTELTSSKGSVYQVKSTLSRAGGESIILLCANPDGDDVVAKVYYESANGAGSSVSTRKRVLEYMTTEEGKRYTLAVTEIGTVEFGSSKYYFEIMPYCPNTDISDDGEYSFEQIVEIAAQLNEALHSIHTAGIIHRDIKPENIYYLDGVYKLGDFGIAKDGVAGRSNVTKHILGTEGYAAPETRRYIYHEKSDYYSLGVTLASLFEGHFVFENMDFEMQSKAQESEKLPLKRLDAHREQLENLLNGLCKISSKQRFGYDEVKRWLADHDYTGGVLEEEWTKAFRLLSDIYHDERSMFEGITKDAEHWEEAKTMLYSKIIEQFFMSFRTDLARAAQVSDELYRAKNRDKGLAVFLNKLYSHGAIVWKGYTFKSLSELADKMLGTKNPKGYGEILQNNCISDWLSNADGIEVDSDTLPLVTKIEELSKTEPEIACYWFGNSFAKKRSVVICGKKVSTMGELVKTMFASPKAFYSNGGCTKLLSRTDGADLYGFLFSYGYKEAVNKAWEQLEKVDLFDKTTILLSMLDDIATKEKAKPERIRSFYVTYGPIGIATYTKKLADRTENKVYTALDSDGRQVLSKITGFKSPASGTVDSLYKAYLPLIESVERLRKNIIDNPHCVLAGVYDSKGVICSNLLGCFAYKVFDRFAPLGFNALLESEQGGTK